MDTVTVPRSAQVKLTYRDGALEALQEVQHSRRTADLDGSLGWDLGDIELELRNRLSVERHNAFAIGELYSIAKELVAPGEFTQWVEKLGLWSYSQAAAYMAVYEVCLGRPELADLLDNTALLKVCAGNFPKGLREQIFNCGGLDDDASVRDLVEAANRVRAGEWTLTSPEVVKLLKKSEAEQIEAAARAICENLEEVARQSVRELEKLLRGNPEMESDIHRKIREAISKVKQLVGLSD